MEQLVAHRAHNPEVAGSNPAPATTGNAGGASRFRRFAFRPEPRATRPSLASPDEVERQEQGDGEDEAAHEARVGEPEQPVLPRQHLAERVQVVDHAVVDPVPVHHDLLHAHVELALLQVHEVAEEEDVGAALADLFEGVDFTRHLRPRAEDGEDDGDEGRDEHGRRRDHQPRVGLEPGGDALEILAT